MDGGIRVPTLVRWPGHLAAGQVVEQPVSLMDVFPTVADLLQSPLPAHRHIDGTSLIPLASGKTVAVSGDQRVLLHYCGDDVHAARYMDGTVFLNALLIVYDTFVAPRNNTVL